MEHINFDDVVENLDKLRNTINEAVEKKGGAIVYEGFCNENDLLLYVTHSLWKESGDEPVEDFFVEGVRNKTLYADDNPEYDIEVTVWALGEDGEFVDDPRLVNAINSTEYRVHDDEEEFMRALAKKLGADVGVPNSHPNPIVIPEPS